MHVLIEMFGSFSTPIVHQDCIKKKLLYANTTIVALTYTCVQRHVSRKQNILYIHKGFHPIYSSVNSINLNII